MRRALRLALAAAVAAAVLLLGVGIGRGTRWQVVVEADVAAPPAAVQAQLSDLRAVAGWLFDPNDPAFAGAVTLEERPGGPPRRFRWDTPETNGVFTLESVDPTQGITYAMDLEDGASHATGSLRWTPTATGVHLVWTDAGDLGMWPIGGLLTPILEASLRDHFAAGLDRLAARATAAAPAAGP
jgi:uncharacterized protein YndB with AHSA1/START domain